MATYNPSPRPEFDLDWIIEFLTVNRNNLMLCKMSSQMRAEMMGPATLELEFSVLSAGTIMVPDPADKPVTQTVKRVTTRLLPADKPVTQTVKRVTTRLLLRDKKD